MSSILHVECKLPMEFIPGGFGTADAVIIQPGVSLQVIDAKFGTGVKVSASSEQLLCYALAAYDKWGEEHAIPKDRVTTIIHQPGLKHIDEYTWDAAELDDGREFLRQQSNKAEVGPPVAEFKAGDHCRFCPARTNCPELQKVALERAKDVFGENEPARMEPERIAEELELVPALKTYIAAIEARAHELLNEGQVLPGWKMVEGRRGAKKWLNEVDVVNFLGQHKIPESAMFDKKIKSPTQMLKVEGVDALDMSELVSQSAGKPTLVPESDKRKPISAASLVFENIMK